MFRWRSFEGVESNKIWTNGGRDKSNWLNLKDPADDLAWKHLNSALKKGLGQKNKPLKTTIFVLFCILFCFCGHLSRNSTTLFWVYWKMNRLQRSMIWYVDVVGKSEVAERRNWLYKLYLLLCPDPNGPLAGLLMPLMNTRLEVAHMDNLKTIMERFNNH